METLHLSELWAAVGFSQDSKKPPTEYLQHSFAPEHKSEANPNKSGRRFKMRMRLLKEIQIRL